MKLSVKDWLKSVWTVIEKHWFKLFWAAFLRNLIATLASSLAFALFLDLKLWNLLISTIIYALVWCSLEVGYIKMCLSAGRDEPMPFKVLFSGLHLAPLFFVIILIYVFATTLGVFALVIPGIFVCVRFSMAGFLFIDRNKGLVDSFKTSLNLTKGYSRILATLFLSILTMIFLPINILAIAEILLTVSICLLYLHLDQIKEAEA